MKDKIGARDQISFVLNGKPLEPAQPKAMLICPRCKVDRFQQGCPGPLLECPMVATAQ